MKKYKVTFVVEGNSREEIKKKLKGFKGVSIKEYNLNKNSLNKLKALKKARGIKPNLDGLIKALEAIDLIQR